jgi:DNA ligase-1
MITKPMLAGTAEKIEDIVFPCLCTPKLDGVRCLVVDGGAVTRNFNPFPNTHVRALVSELPNGFDGEIIVKGKEFNDVTRAVMRENGAPDFTYAVFDYCVDEHEGYSARMKRLEYWDNQSLGVPDFVEKILPVEIKNREDFLEYETQCLKAGFEGVMVRSRDGRYKFGRSSVKEGLLVKWKQFAQDEAVILECVEKMNNENFKGQDAFGRGKRGHSKEGMVPAGTLGAFRVRDLKTDIEFTIGSGFTAEFSAEVWADRADYIGKIVTYKHQPSGAKDAPRFPVFLGMRDKRDL